MPTRIDLAEARRMLIPRARLRANGMNDRRIRDSIREGLLIRVHRGSYVECSRWNALWPEGQHLLQVLAVRDAAPHPGPVFSHAAAAVIWGLPLRLGALPMVETVLTGARHSRVAAGVVRRALDIEDDDIVELDGLRVTSLRRTIVDLARTRPPEVALPAADAALRLVSVRGHLVDAEAAGCWRDSALTLTKPGLRGVRQARWTLDFADGRAQLPGESVSRLQLYRLGFEHVDIQVPVVGAEGDAYRMDFAFGRARAFGEYDGEDKYRDPVMLAGRSVEDAVLAEKRREDDVRGATGWRVVRWRGAHIRTPDALLNRLAAFGIHPPG